MEFLRDHLTNYLQYIEQKNYSGFWPELHTAWFSQWPERAAHFLNTKGLLSPNQETELGKEINACKKVHLNNSHGIVMHDDLQLEAIMYMVLLIC